MLCAGQEAHKQSKSKKLRKGEFPAQESLKRFLSQRRDDFIFQSKLAFLFFNRHDEYDVLC